MVRFTLDDGETGPVRQPQGALWERMSRSAKSACCGADMRSRGPGGELPRCQRGIDGIAARRRLSFPSRARTIEAPCLAIRFSEAMFRLQGRTRFISGFPISAHRIWLVFCCDVPMSLAPFRALLAGASAPVRLLASAIVRALWEGSERSPVLIG